LQVLISRFRKTGWWAHQGSNLGPAGAETDLIKVCGAEKVVYLSDTEAGNRHWTLNDIKLSLHKALAKAGSALPEIECD
jgi:hypothetical protein